MSIAAALAESTHHSAPRSGWPGTHEAPRGQETTRVTEEPDRLSDVRPQDRVQRHTVEQLVVTAPGLPALDAPVPLVVEQLADVLPLVEVKEGRRMRGWTSWRTGCSQASQ